MLTGQPQMLTSKFKISYGLGLNVFAGTNGSADDCKLKNFVNKSMLHSDIQKEVNGYISIKEQLQEKLGKKEEELKFCRTPIENMREYKAKIALSRMSSNKAKKKIRRDLSAIEDEFKFIKTDMVKLESTDNIQEEIDMNDKLTANANGYVSSAIDRLVKILTERHFLTMTEGGHGEITELGVIASQLQEVHPLALAEIYKETNGFENLDTPEIAGLFSCFSNVSVSDELKSISPTSRSHQLNNTTTSLLRFLNLYQDIEIKNNIDTGTSYDINYDLQQHIMDWCRCEDEIMCKKAIEKVKQEKGIFLGEFVKAVLKINNVAAEFEKICEIVDNVSLLEKIRQIPVLTLKYVATNQSLYI